MGGGEGEGGGGSGKVVGWWVGKGWEVEGEVMLPSAHAELIPKQPYLCTEHVRVRKEASRVGDKYQGQLSRREVLLCFSLGSLF